jgi:hypothetical protein
MNYERNFLATLFQVHTGAVELSRQVLRDQLLEVYREDPVGFFDALLQLDLTGEYGGRPE